MQAPGFNSIRVPARFWVMGTLSMSMVVAFVVAALLRARRAAVSGVLVGRARRWACCRTGGSCTCPPPLCRPGRRIPRCCAASVVLYLPAGNITDVRSHLLRRRPRAGASVNGYSGFEPNHYDGVRQASKFELDGLFTAFTESADLHVWWPPMRRACASWSSGSRVQYARPRAPRPRSTSCPAARAPWRAAWDACAGGRGCPRPARPRRCCPTGTSRRSGRARRRMAARRSR